VGTTALSRKIRRDRALSGYAPLTAALEAELAAVPHERTPNTGSSQEKVLHRLLSSRTLAATVSKVIDDLRCVVLGDNWVPRSIDNGQGNSDGDIAARGVKRAKILLRPDDDADDDAVDGGSQANSDEFTNEQAREEREEGSVTAHHGVFLLPVEMPKISVTVILTQKTIPSSLRHRQDVSELTQHRHRASHRLSYRLLL